MVEAWQVSLLLVSESANSPGRCVSAAVAHLCLLREQGCCLAIIRHQRIPMGEVGTCSVEG